MFAPGFHALSGDCPDARVAINLTPFGAEHFARPGGRQDEEFEGEPVNRIFEQIRWEAAANLAGYDFLDGDVEFVKSLTSAAEA